MPDFSQFIKYYNASLPAPTSNDVMLHTTSTGAGSDSADAAGTANSFARGGGDVATFTRVADAMWRTVVSGDAKDGAVGGAASSAAGSGAGAAAGGYSGNTTIAAGGGAGAAHVSITVGRMTVSTEDRWRIQANMRREEAKSGQARKEYNKKVTRAIKVTKGPSPNPADAFPPGRGRLL